MCVCVCVRARACICICQLLCSMCARKCTCRICTGWKSEWAREPVGAWARANFLSDPPSLLPYSPTPFTLSFRGPGGLLARSSREYGMRLSKSLHGRHSEKSVTSYSSSIEPRCAAFFRVSACLAGEPCRRWREAVMQGASHRQRTDGSRSDDTSPSNAQSSAAAFFRPATRHL